MDTNVCSQFNKLFTPRSVALIGATPRPGSIGQWWRAICAPQGSLASWSYQCCRCAASSVSRLLQTRGIHRSCRSGSGSQCLNRAVE
jgi:hypothetical protein